ncbi:MAG: hypothetical protein U0Z26_17040 [Anaerolineales bacterium]
MSKNKKGESGSNTAAIITGVATIVVAIIGCFGAVAVAGIEPFAGYLLSLQSQSSATSLPIQEADKATSIPFTAGAAGVTAATTEPSVVALPVPGEDWNSNCIDARVWKPELAGNRVDNGTPCYQLSTWGINPANGSLILASNHSQSRAFEYGLFTTWQDWRELDFTVNAKHLDNSEIWLGFFESDSLSSQGVLFVIQPGDVIDFREMPSEHPIVDNIYMKYAEGKFHSHIVLEGGKIAVSVDEQGIISEWPVNFQVKNIFIGYRSLPNTNLDASISDLRFVK